jgi:hypothetical protein
MEKDNHKSNSNEDDLDSILKELEDKNNKKKFNQNSKLPFVSTKDKFYNMNKHEQKK